MMKCCICNKVIKGHGHNPWPIKRQGKCCDSCNVKVLVARVEEAMKGEGHDNH